MEAVQKTLKMDILKEIDEKRKRESNIIIIGIPERGDVNDLDLAKMLICDTLNCPTDILSSHRISKPSDWKPSFTSYFTGSQTSSSCTVFCKWVKGQ